MASNYVSDGDTLTFIAPSNLKGGVPAVINDLLVVPLHGGTKDSIMVGKLGGVWRLPVNGALKCGQKVAWLDIALVAAGTDKAIPYGKLLSDAVNGYAEALLIQQ